MGQLQLSMKSWNDITRHSYSQAKKKHTIFYKKEKGWVIFFIIIISALFIIATKEISFQILHSLPQEKLEFFSQMSGQTCLK